MELKLGKFEFEYNMELWAIWCLRYNDLKVRRQYLFVDGRTVLAFVTNGEKFAECANYTDITADVKCKVIC